MALNINEQARKEANIRLLQRSMDRSISNILGSATHVVLYNFDQSSQSWEKSNVEGSLVLAIRPSGYLLVILNRNSPNNYPIVLTKDFQLQQNDPYLIFKNYENENEGISNATIRGIWFPNASERSQMNDLLTDVLQNLRNSATSSQKTTTSLGETAGLIDPASATAALLASLNVGTNASASANITLNQHSASSSGTATSTANQMRQMSPSSTNQQPTLDKKSLQLALLSLIQDDRFLDLLHAQYLKVHHARTNRTGNGSKSTTNNMNVYDYNSPPPR